MKIILERWNRFLKEGKIINSRDEFTCPEEDYWGDTYYNIDRDNPPTIEQIAECYFKNNARVRGVSIVKPCLYDTKELEKFREYDKENLRHIVRDDGVYDQLKADIEEKGIEDSTIIYFGRNGKVKLGEGNHRHQIALELDIEKIPVAFVFHKYVNGLPPNGKAYTIDAALSREVQK